MFFICFVIPGFVMVYCYTKFVWSVAKVNRDVRNFQSTNTTKRMDTPMRLALLVLLLCFAFFICWIPFHVFHMVRAIGISVSQKMCTNLRDILSTMAYVNACINPILYSVSLLAQFCIIWIWRNFELSYLDSAQFWIAIFECGGYFELSYLNLVQFSITIFEVGEIFNYHIWIYNRIVETS